ncbi:HTH CENPB-type domain-containing protein [Trichonephila clavata]|uniref:HTH CENPB-type domain-containing protein n=1 Tax=Trichonephila clavata TaxID=2740835 RepID=A0A8X6HWU2_TRICU|nr:HTH CENPB-type domain-containing protein [Trichonephila clavata]
MRQRKITKHVSQKETAILEEILVFRNFSNTDIAFDVKFDKDFVLNIYQTGCQYQLSFNMTLAHKGRKNVFVKRQDINKVTHFYTAQYALTLSAKLLPKVFVCLQEPTCKFGPRVKQIVVNTQKNIKTSFKSGKPQQDYIFTFFKNV